MLDWSDEAEWSYGMEWWSRVLECTGDTVMEWSDGTVLEWSDGTESGAECLNEVLE